MDGLTTSSPQELPASKDGELERWLHEARNGSQSALGRALEVGRKYLLVVANRQLPERIKAKVGASDLVQDTFLEAQRGFGAFRGATQQEFYGWLLGILSNRVANKIRHYDRTQRRNIALEQPLALFDGAAEQLRDPGHTPGTSVLAREEQRRVRTAIERLGEPMKTVLIERTWQGATFADIGARINCSADAARKTWVRAVRKLEKLLADIE